jgi:hypothetical protein
VFNATVRESLTQPKQGRRPLSTTAHLTGAPAGSMIHLCVSGTANFACVYGETFQSGQGRTPSGEGPLTPAQLDYLSTLVKPQCELAVAGKRPGAQPWQAFTNGGSVRASQTVVLNFFHRLGAFECGQTIMDQGTPFGPSPGSCVFSSEDDYPLAIVPATGYFTVVYPDGSTEYLQSIAAVDQYGNFAYDATVEFPEAWWDGKAWVPYGADDTIAIGVEILVNQQLSSSMDAVYDADPRATLESRLGAPTQVFAKRVLGLDPLSDMSFVYQGVVESRAYVQKGGAQFLVNSRNLGMSDFAGGRPRASAKKGAADEVPRAGGIGLSNLSLHAEIVVPALAADFPDA